MSGAGLTPSQTVGPFLHLALADPADRFAVPEGTEGAVWLRGTVVDGDGAAVADAVVETWQVRPPGVLPGGWVGFGRCATDAAGAWAVLTCKPAAVPALDGRAQAPHVAVAVFARGLLDRVVTRCWFGDEVAANAADPVLSGLVDPARRSTLIAVPAADGYRFDVRLQGPGETVFFEL